MNDDKRNPMGINTTAYENARNKSINGNPVKRNPQWIKIDKKFLRQCFVAVGAVAIAIGMGVSNIASNISDNIDSSSYIYKNRSIVNETKHRIDDSGNFYYDTDSIAYTISSLDEDVDKDAIVYATYMNLDYNRLKNMNEVMTCLRKYEDSDSKFKQYNSFEQYVIDFGFVEKNGEADIEGYKDYMDGYVCNLEKLEKYQESGGKTR